MGRKIQPEWEKVAWGADDLTAWRKSFGWTQADAAKALEMSLRGYQKREWGQAKITRETALACLYIRDHEKLD